VKKNLKIFSDKEFRESTEKKTELFHSMYLKLKLFEYKFISIQEKENVLAKSKEILVELELLENDSKGFSWFASDHVLMFKCSVMQMLSNLKILFPKK
jgi:hypothetical protein